MGIDPSYVLDRMEMYEVRALMKHSSKRNRDSWEQTRMLAFVMARCAGAKNLDRIQDIMRFPWEDGPDDKPEIAPTTKEDVEMLKAKARYFINAGLV